MKKHWLYTFTGIAAIVYPFVATALIILKAFDLSNLTWTAALAPIWIAAIFGLCFYIAMLFTGVLLNLFAQG